MNETIEYQLEKTVAGKPKPMGPIVLENKEGITLKAPWPPKANCKKCYGRGFIGKNSTTKELVPCRKCYPWKNS